MEEHATNGQQQEQEGDRDPRSLPPRLPWAEQIAQHNRSRVADRQRIVMLQMQLEEAWRENRKLRKINRELNDENGLLLEAIGWDDMVDAAEAAEAASEKYESEEDPPF